MSDFEEISAILDKLLGPKGCPWDKEQTMKSIRSAAIEEACELKEAIELNDNRHMREELGDLFLTAVFLAKLAEKEKRFTMAEMFQELSDKLIRRHPHVFGSAEVADSHAVKNQWEKIKQSEKGKEQRRSLLDSIPKGLSAMHRAQKILHKIARTNYKHKKSTQQSYTSLQGEDSFATALLEIIRQAEQQNLDLEHALRVKLNELENDFRHFEITQASNP